MRKGLCMCVCVSACLCKCAQETLLVKDQHQKFVLVNAKVGDVGQTNCILPHSLQSFTASQLMTKIKIPWTSLENASTCCTTLNNYYKFSG